MRLTPGVAVFPAVFAGLDTDGSGVLSEAEQRAYAERVLGNLSLTANGTPLRLRLVSWQYPKVSEMKEGQGDIELVFDAEVLRRGRSRHLVFENHHQSRIAVYLVNCLVPDDPYVQVTAQKRNFQQSRYELDYVQADVLGSQPPAVRRPNRVAWLGAALLLLCTPLALLWRWRVRAGKAVRAQKEGMSWREAASLEGKRV